MFYQALTVRTKRLSPPLTCPGDNGSACMNKRSTHASSLITGRQQRSHNALHPFFFFRPSQCCWIQGDPHLFGFPEELIFFFAALGTFNTSPDEATRARSSCFAPNITQRRKLALLSFFHTSTSTHVHLSLSIFLYLSFSWSVEVVSPREAPGVTRGRRLLPGPHLHLLNKMISGKDNSRSADYNGQEALGLMEA